MRTFAALLVLFTALVGGCDPEATPAPEPEPEPEPEPVLPPCDEAGSLYGIDLTRNRFDLTPGIQVPVLLGFQGFLFLELGLRSPTELKSSMDIFTRVQLEGGADLTATTSEMRSSHDPDTGWRSDPVLVFFNDVPLAELHGKHATLTASAATSTCVLTGSVDVLLFDGGVAP